MSSTSSAAMGAAALTAAHRCDRCGARAYVATRHDRGFLTWCGHHFVEFETALAGRVLRDDRNGQAARVEG